MRTRQRESEDTEWKFVIFPFVDKRTALAVGVCPLRIGSMMRSTLQESAPPYIGVDLTDRYARGCRPSDVCGLKPNGNGTFTASFWLWHWDAAPKMLDVTSIALEVTAARVSMFDGPQGLAGAGHSLRACERASNCVGKTGHVRRIVDITRSVVPGEDITLIAWAKPGTRCAVVYLTPRGNPSNAAGLAPKLTDETGIATWKWRVGSSTSPGNATVTVTCGHERANESFVVQRNVTP